jgi:putative membrane protein
MNKGMMWIALCAVVGIGLLLAGLAPAQEQNMNGNMNSNMNSNMKSSKSKHDNKNSSGNMNMSDGQSNSNMSGMNSNSSGMNHDMTKSSDMKFMTTAAQGGMAEVALARYAVEHAASDAVKQYAQHMIDDHTKANDELMQVATTKGLTLPTTPDPKHQALMDKLMKLSGADFDREYIKNAGVKDHEKMEKLFMDESSKGQAAEAKAFAAKTLPAVQMHLSMARDLATNMMNTKKSTNANANMSAPANANNSNM